MCIDTPQDKHVDTTNFIFQLVLKKLIFDFLIGFLKRNENLLKIIEKYYKLENYNPRNFKSTTIIY